MIIFCTFLDLINPGTDQVNIMNQYGMINFPLKGFTAGLKYKVIFTDFQCFLLGDVCWALKEINCRKSSSVIFSLSLVINREIFRVSPANRLLGIRLVWICRLVTIITRLSGSVWALIDHSPGLGRDMVMRS